MEKVSKSKLLRKILPICSLFMLTHNIASNVQLECAYQLYSSISRFTYNLADGVNGDNAGFAPSTTSLSSSSISSIASGTPPS